MPSDTVAELTRVNAWLWNQLHSDPTILAAVGNRIYADEAPQGALTPMVIFAFMGGSDRLLTSRSRLTQLLYLVRAVDASASYDTVATVADRIEAVMSVPVLGFVQSDVRITSCFREQPHQRKDTQYGISTVYLGGFYRISIQPSDQ